MINNGTVYLSGQVAEDPDADVQDQTRSTLGRIDALLAEAGNDLSARYRQPFCTHERGLEWVGP